MRMLTKLKYVGTKTKDLIEIYSMFIRSTAEYCSTVFHSNLTERLSNKIESIQKTSLKIILGQITYLMKMHWKSVVSKHYQLEEKKDASSLD